MFRLFNTIIPALKAQSILKENQEQEPSDLEQRKRFHDCVSLFNQEVKKNKDSNVIRVRCANFTEDTKNKFKNLLEEKGYHRVKQCDKECHEYMWQTYCEVTQIETKIKIK